MKTHLENLKTHTPDILERKVLDIGSGRGGFLIDVALKGGNVCGVEKSKEYIEETLNIAKENNIPIDVREGVAEKLPFSDDEFGFVNISEVIEHVENPDALISETYRTLKSGGRVYISVPSRFGLKDPHFHLYFVNFLPRFMADSFISLFGKHKNYSGDAGRQRLKEMHYYRFRKIKSKLIKAGFKVFDIREKKIKNKIKNKMLRFVLLFIYKSVRPFYFDTFHLVLQK